MLAYMLALRYACRMAKRAAYRLFYSEARARAGRSAWILVCPAALSADGKRKQTAYNSEKAAKAALKTALAAQEQLGSSLRQLPPASEALCAYKLAADTVAPYSITVQNAASFAAACCAEFGDLSTALQLARWAAARASSTQWPDVTVKQAMDELLANSAHLSPATMRARSTTFKRLYNEATLFCENTYLHSLTADHCRELLAPYKKTAQTFNHYRRIFSSLLSWAAEKGYMPTENPMLAVKPQLCAEAKIVALQPEDLATLLRACESKPAVQLYFAICAFAGIRPTEVTRLRWVDLSPDEPIISVRSQSSKTGGARHINIRPVLQAWIEHCKPARITPSAPLCPVSAHELQAARRTIPTWQADVLRHSFASYALKHGTSLAELQLDMGHTNLAMLRARYLNLEGLTREKAALWWSLTPDKVLK